MTDGEGVWVQTRLIGMDSRGGGDSSSDNNHKPCNAEKDSNCRRVQRSHSLSSLPTVASADHNAKSSGCASPTVSTVMLRHQRSLPLIPSPSAPRIKKLDHPLAFACWVTHMILVSLIGVVMVYAFYMTLFSTSGVTPRLSTLMTRPSDEL